MNTSLEQYLAKHRKSRKKFSRLHGDYLQQEQNTMSKENLNQAGNGPTATQARAEFARTAVPANAPNVSPERGVTPVSSQIVVGEVKPVDRRTVTGSYNGKTVGYDAVGDPVKAVMDQIANPPGPREKKGMGLTSSKLDSPAAVAHTEPSSEVE
jgi:hypothetical protein